MSGEADPKVLIVDDDADVLEAIRAWLEVDYRCTGCATIAAAMEAARREPFQLAVVDYRLPDGRGPDLIRALKDLHPRMAVVFMTGFGDYSVATEAVESGAVTLLEKPFHRQKLQSAARAALMAASETPGGLPRDERLTRVLAYVRDNMGSGPRENQLLRDLGFSRSAFHVFFRGSMGIPFRDYVALERLKTARYLLSATTLGTAQIAQRVGLRSSSYFTAWFRSRTGETPLAYRRSARAAEGRPEAGG